YLLMNNYEIGRLGEDAVAYYLEKNGYEVLDRNYRTARGEIDIIFSDGDYLVFGEVKTRNSLYFGRPCQAVDINKKIRIVNTAKNFIVKNNFYDMNIRFDVFEFYYKSRKILHIKTLMILSYE
ncbi:MAG: YraN family protein, partial [Peptostreptococcus anaerobius]